MKESPRRKRSTMNSQYVETDDGQVVFLDFEVCGEGGFGEVYRGHFDCSPTPVAVKFMRNPDVTGYQKQVAEEIAHKSLLRFEHEIALLIKLNDEVVGNPFVNCQGHGKWNGHGYGDPGTDADQCHSHGNGGNIACSERTIHKYPPAVDERNITWRKHNCQPKLQFEVYYLRIQSFCQKAGSLNILFSMWADCRNLLLRSNHHGLNSNPN